MFRGVTPTLVFTFPQGTDFTNTDVYLSIADSNKNELLRVGEDGLSIEDNVISLFLTQEQTLSLPSIVLFQFNWTYNNKRACSNIVSINTKRNLANEVLP